MKNLAILLTVSLIAAAAAYFAFVSGGIDEMTLIADSGKVIIERGGEQIRVGDSKKLEEGDLIKTDGSAHLRLADDRFAFLEGVTRVSVTNDHALDGQGGSLRAKSSGNDPFRVTFGDVAANATNSNFRIDQGVGSTRVGTYGGVVHLSTPGEPDLQVPQFFEAAIAVGDLPDDARPYRFRGGDVWDEEILADIMALDSDLTQKAAALSGNLGAKPALGYFDGLAKGNVDFMRRYLKRSTEDLLIGFTIANNASEGSMEHAFTRAFDLRDDGGRWGIVAGIIGTQGTSDRLVAELQELVVGTGVAGGSNGSGDTAEFTVAAGDGTTSGTGGDVNNPSDPNNPTVNNPNNPNEPNEPKDPEAPDCSSGPECDGQEAIDKVNDILPEDDPSPSSPPDEDDPPLTNGVLGGGDGLP